MNLLDYALRDMQAGVYYDEYGNLYIDNPRYDFLLPHIYIDIGTVFISREDCDKHRQYEIIMPDGFEYDGMARRPYFRMRGKPITQGQAFEIIRRTDMFFDMIKAVYDHDDYVGCHHFKNWLIGGNHYPRGYGWIHADGTVGVNAITDTYPRLGELIAESIALLCNFPCLDYAVALTDWNEIPPEAWDMLYGDDGGRQDFFEDEEYDKNFYKAVVMDIHVHDKKIEILPPDPAVSKYKEYASLYGKDRSLYLPDYYDKNGIVQTDGYYLRRCIEAYGLDADAVIGRIPGFIWKGGGA